MDARCRQPWIIFFSNAGPKRLKWAILLFWTRSRPPFRCLMGFPRPQASEMWAMISIGLGRSSPGQRRLLHLYDLKPDASAQ